MRLNFLKKERLQIFTPVNGSIIPIEEVPDSVFSQKMMGEGVAIMPSGGGIFAPVDGTVIQIAPTNHAISILSKDGTEILIHIGVETISLRGEGFRVVVQLGEKISVGQLLIEVDWEIIRAFAKSMITPIVITNAQECDKHFIITEEKVGKIGKTVIMTSST